MNTDYVIQIKPKAAGHGVTAKRRMAGHKRRRPGIVRQCSGDQLLSHLLPLLAGDQPSLRVSVERKRRRTRKFRERRGGSASSPPQISLRRKIKGRAS